MRDPVRKRWQKRSDDCSKILFGTEVRVLVESNQPWRHQPSKGATSALYGQHKLPSWSQTLRKDCLGSSPLQWSTVFELIRCALKDPTFSVPVWLANGASNTSFDGKKSNWSKTRATSSNRARQTVHEDGFGTEWDRCAQRHRTQHESSMQPSRRPAANLAARSLCSGLSSMRQTDLRPAVVGTASA